MAVQISTNIEFIQANTNTNAGFILLPSTTTLAGRLLTIKDTTGTFGLRPLTLSTIGNDRFEEGVNLKRLVEPFGYITLASDGVNRWYTIDGTSMNTYTISTLTNPVSISTQSMFTSSATVSTLGFEDRAFNSISSFYTRSTLLYLGSNIIGGSKCGPTLFVPIRSPFLPNQVSGLSVWLDAADINTTVTTGGTGLSLTQWRDKSANALSMNQAVLINMPTVAPRFLNGNNVVGFTTSQNLVSGTNLTLGGAQTWFVVFNPVTTFNYFFIEQSPNVNTTAGSFLYGSNANLFAINRSGIRRFVNDTVSLPFSINNWYFCSFVNSNAVTTTSDVYWSINGTQRSIAYIAGSNNTVAGNATNLLYLNNNGRVPASNYYAEILIFNSAVSLSQVYQVEGYLAWKWGLAGNLPAAHPFKNAPP